MHISVLHLVVLVVALFTNAAPVEKDLGGLTEVLNSQVNHIQQAINSKYDLDKSHIRNEAPTVAFFNEKIKRYQLPKADYELLKDYYKRLSDIHSSGTVHNYRYAAKANTMFLQGFSKYIQNYEEWKQNVLKAVRNVDWHLLMASVSKENLLEAYAMAYHALKHRGQLFHDSEAGRVRYDLFPEAAVEALLPSKYDDIQNAHELQDSRFYLLYSHDSHFAQNDNLAQRFDKAYAELKQEKPKTDDSFPFQSKETMDEWLKHAAEVKMKQKEAGNADEKAIQKASDAASSSNPSSAGMPGIQQQHASASSVGSMVMKPSNRGYLVPGQDAYATLQDLSQLQNYHLVHPGSAGHPSTFNAFQHNYHPHSSSTNANLYNNIYQSSHNPFAQFHTFRQSGFPHPAGTANYPSTQAPQGYVFHPQGRAAFPSPDLASAAQGSQPVQPYKPYESYASNAMPSFSAPYPMTQMANQPGNLGHAGIHAAFQPYHYDGSMQGEAGSTGYPRMETQNLPEQFGRGSSPHDGESNVDPKNWRLWHGGK